MRSPVRSREEVLESLRGNFSGKTPPGIPLYTPSAVEVLEEILEPDFVAFEFGSGASTIWLAERVRSLTSVEHDPIWHNKVTSALRDLNILNVGSIYLPDEHSYAESITWVGGPFDIILIDGIVRRKCLRNSIDKVRSGGYLLLDNSDRVRYKKDMRKLSHCWKRIPTGNKHTAIWKKP